MKNKTAVLSILIVLLVLALVAVWYQQFITW